MMERRGFLKRLGGAFGVGVVAPAALVQSVSDVGSVPVVTSGYLKTATATTGPTTVTAAWVDHNDEVIHEASDHHVNSALAEISLAYMNANDWRGVPTV